ncbi:hypothetical protein AAEX28_01095 [Lentisphaerota bacterium WC36G]|nr:hypothetical protein LJT99_03975 [Lentisphaerae bacterium WC36]
MQQKNEITGRYNATCEYSPELQDKIINNILSKFQEIQLDATCEVQRRNTLVFSKKFTLKNRIKHHKYRNFLGIECKLEIERNYRKQLSFIYHIKFQKKFMACFNISIVLCLGTAIFIEYLRHSYNFNYFAGFALLLFFFPLYFMMPDPERDLKNLLKEATQKAVNS